MCCVVKRTESKKFETCNELIMDQPGNSFHKTGFRRRKRPILSIVIRNNNPSGIWSRLMLQKFPGWTNRIMRKRVPSSGILALFKKFMHSLHYHCLDSADIPHLGGVPEGPLTGFPRGRHSREKIHFFLHCAGKRHCIDMHPGREFRFFGPNLISLCSRILLQRYFSHLRRSRSARGLSLKKYLWKNSAVIFVGALAALNARVSARNTYVEHFVKVCGTTHSNTVTSFK